MHRPVLLHEVIDYLNLTPGKKILDCTLGGGGHARAILEHITPNGILIGIDQDEEALKAAGETLKGFKDNIRLVRGNFRDLEAILTGLSIGDFDGVIYDLGISSLQLEKEERGFSIKLAGPLDMRMDRDGKIDAGYLVNKLKEPELAQIIEKLGEEHYARRIARAIISKRPITNTHELAEAVMRAVPPSYRHGRIHPATRTFQALRIAVNDELKALEASLTAVVKYIKRGGRICVISFHSLEDRITKQLFNEFGKMKMLRVITRKPIRPQNEEILLNVRARSARLRVAEAL